MVEIITVIGGSGFLGTNLCRYFSKNGQDFEIIDLKKSNEFPEHCKIADIRDIDSLRKSITGNLLINLAAVHRDDIVDKNEYYETNVVGTRNVIEICSELNIEKIIFTSSVAVYGFAEPGTDENGVINPFNEYGRTKFAAEEYLRKWQAENQNELIIVRPTVIFGEGNRGNVYNLISQIASGQFIMIGAGTNYKSMAYVGNVVAFVVKCIESKEVNGLYNYVDTPDLDMNTLVSQVRQTLKNSNKIGPRIPYRIGLAIGYVSDVITKITGKKLPVSSIRIKKFCSSSSFKTSKSNLDDFCPPYTLQQGINYTLKSEFISPDENREIFYTE
jgi:GlcNAc-P-P-Und epimerase